MSFETDYSSGKYHWFTIMACSERDHIWNLIPQLKSPLPKYSLCRRRTGKEGVKEKYVEKKSSRDQKNFGLGRRGSLLVLQLHIPILLENCFCSLSWKLVKLTLHHFHSGWANQKTRRTVFTVKVLQTERKLHRNCVTVFIEHFFLEKKKKDKWLFKRK